MTEIVNMILPGVIATGLTIFKANQFGKLPLQSMGMYVEIGSCVAGYVVTNLVSDYAFQLRDPDTFGKRIEALAIEPPFYAGLYTAGRKLMGSNNLSIESGLFEGILIYACSQFISQPFIQSV